MIYGISKKTFYEHMSRLDTESTNLLKGVIEETDHLEKVLTERIEELTKEVTTLRQQLKERHVIS